MIQLQGNEVIYNNSENLGVVHNLRFIDCCFVIPLSNGSMLTIAECGCSTNELEVFRAFHKYYENFGGTPSIKTLESVRSTAILEMSRMCNYKIRNEFFSDCLGSMMQFDCDEFTDQPKIFAYYFKAILMMSADPTCANVDSANLRWRPSSDDFCRNFTPLQIQKLGEDLQVHITEKTDRYHVLKVWTRNKTDMELLESWKWDMSTD